MKETLENLTVIICSYLRINEDLFFCTKRSLRISEAKKYFCYFAYFQCKIPPSKIAAYLGVSERRSSVIIDMAKRVRSVIHNDESGQPYIDIESISKLILK